MKIKTNSPLRLFRRYGFLGSCRLIIDLLFTKLLFPKARLIRRPYYFRGFNHISLGNNLTAGVGLRLDAFSCIANRIVLSIGNDVEVNDYVHIGAVDSVKIGNNVLIASKVFISDHNHGAYKGSIVSSPFEKPADREIISAPVEIENNVWLGEGVAILAGVRIGEGSIIGANSVVTRSIPPNTIWAGNPARMLKRYEPETGTWMSI